MNKLHSSLLLVLAASLALVAIGCGDSTVTPIDAGGHPDLGAHDAGTDTGVVVDLGMVDAGPGDGGPGDAGTFLTDAGCWEGPPSTMVQFLNHCTTRSTPAAVTGSGTRSSLIYPDGGVPPIP